MPFNIPILLTWLRIILIPLLIAIYYVPDSWVVDVGRDLAAMLVFVVASVTDWLDGYLARRWNLDAGRIRSPEALLKGTVGAFPHLTGT